MIKFQHNGFTVEHIKTKKFYNDYVIREYFRTTKNGDAKIIVKYFDEKSKKHIATLTSNFPKTKEGYHDYCRWSYGIQFTVNKFLGNPKRGGSTSINSLSLNINRVFNINP